MWFIIPLNEKCAWIVMYEIYSDPAIVKILHNVCVSVCRHACFSWYDCVQVYVCVVHKIPFP